METHELDGVPVRVYCPAKTVADCFKYRNKIGIDVAREALRDTLRQRKARVDEIWRYAEICRVARVIYHYLALSGLIWPYLALSGLIWNHSNEKT